MNTWCPVRAPSTGTGVLMAFQKVGYDGAWIFELAPSAEPAAVLARASRARETFERLLRFEQ